LTYHERARYVKVGGYNIMKKPISPWIIKSTFVLENGGKIFK
jgi:hypothetical protein